VSSLSRGGLILPVGRNSAFLEAIAHSWRQSHGRRTGVEWNPVTGCTRVVAVTTGYALTLAKLTSTSALDLTLAGRHDQADQFAVRLWP
jgi:hypothetical protein